MSLLSIAKDVTDVIGLARPTAIVTGQDPLARQILGLAKETLEELGRMDWPVLQIPYTFDTVPSQTQYALPADFGRDVGDTLYAASRYAALRGSLTPGDWARQRNNLPDLGRFRYRIYGLPLKINVSPTPTTVETFVMEYQTTARVIQADGITLKSTYFDDTDVSLVPEELVKKGLKWRLRRAKGLDYSEEFDDYEQTRSQWLAQALAMGSMAVAYRSPYDGAEIGEGYIPEYGFGA
jgi:hypothetical protein